MKRGPAVIKVGGKTFR
uniref:Uncharacterized protein n=1 Tax=Anguilla anguilla TaxID=7936 RepID=A0A0E9XRS4_ANGAN